MTDNSKQKAVSGGHEKGPTANNNTHALNGNKNPATLERGGNNYPLHLFIPTNTKHCNKKKTKTKATFECAHKKSQTINQMKNARVGRQLLAGNDDPPIFSRPFFPPVSGAANEALISSASSVRTVGHTNPWYGVAAWMAGGGFCVVLVLMLLY